MFIFKKAAKEGLKHYSKEELKSTSYLDGFLDGLGLANEQALKFEKKKENENNVRRCA